MHASPIKSDGGLADKTLGQAPPSENLDDDDDDDDDDDVWPRCRRLLPSEMKRLTPSEWANHHGRTRQVVGEELADSESRWRPPGEY